MAKQDVTTQVIPYEEYEDTMSQVANSSKKAAYIPKRELSRADVVNAFQHCFETIGGVPMMAAWAAENPGDFFKLYARLLPSQATNVLGEKNEFVVKHVLPRGALDE